MTLVYNSTHIPISESDAIEQFNVLELKNKKHTSTKISKSVFVDRWSARKPDSPLCIIKSEKYLDLCWWNGNYWTYITSKLNKQNS